MVGSHGRRHWNLGRARCLRHRDRAQLEFDWMLIDDYLTGGVVGRAAGRRAPQVRYGAGMLADHLPDSTVATAIVPADAPARILGGVPLTVTTRLGRDPVNPVGTDCMRPHATSGSVRSAGTRDRNGARSPIGGGWRSGSPPVERPVSLRGLVRGFFLGAAGTTVIVLILRMLC